jgi:hypothetical protein
VKAADKLHNLGTLATNQRAASANPEAVWRRLPRSASDRHDCRLSPRPAGRPRWRCAATVRLAGRSLRDAIEDLERIAARRAK